MTDRHSDNPDSQGPERHSRRFMEPAAHAHEPASRQNVTGTALCEEDSAKTDPEVTCDPANLHTVVDFWGGDLGGATPRQTLKGPGQTNPILSVLDAAGPGIKQQEVAVEGYGLIEKLGEGGAGVVYRAVQKSLDRAIAFKMIKRRGGWDAAAREKFIAEALVTGRLDHPNIVPVHDLGTTSDGQPFYTMKMVRGTPWHEVMRDKSLCENLFILLDVCDAVSFAHSHGFVHRDLKPENVMLGEFGEVQLMDWGMAAAIGPDGNLLDPTPERAAGGTPVFMAPEMVTGEDGPVGIHSDVYLLGGILYQIVTGHAPHGGKRVLDTLENARANEILPTDKTGPLLDIALKAMRTNPAERYRSVAEFKQALLDYQSHAESIRLSDRARQDLKAGQEQHDYEKFAQALFGFRQALGLWEQNDAAAAGVRETQYEYARCAFVKGDLDLAASTLDPACPDHQGLLEEVRQAQRRREVARRRLKRLRVTAIVLTAAVVSILTLASIWIYVAKQEAVKAKEAEAEQRQVAERAMLKARAEEARAVQALRELEKAYQDLVEAQEQERRAREQAKASEEVATKTRDELARTGMLLDNSWWVFDAAMARQAQAKAAETIGRPVELIINLPGGVELAMILIPPGQFVMGSPPEEQKRAADEHLHRVHILRPFYLSKYELTEAQWQAVVGKQPAGAKDRNPEATLPVVGASYLELTQGLLPALSKYAPEGYVFRLPTEAEWEYACRAGRPTAYHSGDSVQDLDTAGWFLGNSKRERHPVGGKAPNAFGLYDMHGNVSEMCADQYVAGFYLESPIEDPLCTVQGETPVVRGGSVMNMPEHCRAAYRSYVYTKNEYPFVGVRLVLAPSIATQPK